MEKSLSHYRSLVFIELSMSVTPTTPFTSGFSFFTEVLHINHVINTFSSHCFLCNHCAQIFFSKAEKPVVVQSPIMAIKYFVIHETVYIKTASFTIKLNKLKLTVL